MPLYLSCQGQHSTQPLTERRNIVRSNPRSQLHQIIRQHRRIIQHLLHRLHFKVINRRILVHPHHHTHQLLSAERHQHSCPYHRSPTVDRIGKRLIERHRQRNIAEQSHPSSLFVLRREYCLTISG